MDTNKNIGPNGVAEGIFDSYFRPLMGAEEFARALKIFRLVSPHNERSVAIQFFAAVSHNKLREVLEAYEIFTGPEGFLDELGLNEVERAVEVRLFGNFIYAHVIAGGDPEVLLDQVFSVEVPTIFDNMAPPMRKDSPN